MRRSPRAHRLVTPLVVATLAACGEPPSTAGLEAAIRERLAKTPATYGIAFRDLETGAALDLNGDTVLAANLLVGLVSADSVQATIERMGTTRMRVLRGVEDLKAYERGLNNTATARDVAVWMAALARGDAVSEEASAEMVEILKRDEFRDRIPAGVPEGTPVANKVGFITAVDHDAAIVYPPGREPHVLVVLTSGIAEPERSRRVISDVSRIVWDWVMTDR